ncbi:fimbrial protein [Serratia fonticola]
MMLFSNMPALALTTVTVSVTIFVTPKCVINNNNPIEVSFTDAVMTTRVDGSNYLQPVTYSMTCTGQISNAMKMQIKGVDSGFGNGALQTTKDNLAISLVNGTTPVPVNSWLNFTYPNFPVLQAVPVKRLGTTLAGGVFAATATMVVEYQ